MARIPIHLQKNFTLAQRRALKDVSYTTDDDRITMQEGEPPVAEQPVVGNVLAVAEVVPLPPGRDNVIQLRRIRRVR